VAAEGRATEEEHVTAQGRALAEERRGTEERSAARRAWPAAANSGRGGRRDGVAWPATTGKGGAAVRRGSTAHGGRLPRRSGCALRRREQGHRRRSPSAAATGSAPLVEAAVSWFHGPPSLMPVQKGAVAESTTAHAAGRRSRRDMARAEGRRLSTVRYAGRLRRTNAATRAGPTRRREQGSRSGAACAPKEEEVAVDDRWVPMMTGGSHS
jgi:hypothetical protein